MAKTRSALVTILQRLGERLLGFFSRCEERYFLPSLSRALKLTILGLLVSAVGWLSARSVPYPGPICYGAPLYWNVFISDVSVTPNPTEGADSVTVRAEAAVGNNPSTKNPHISSAYMKIVGDTIPISMKAVEDKFSDSLETVEGRLYVGAMEPESTWVELRINTSSGGGETNWIPLVISEPDTTRAED